MFELRDAIGRPLFEQIVICLVCDDCMKTGKPLLSPFSNYIHSIDVVMFVADHPEK